MTSRKFPAVTIVAPPTCCNAVSALAGSKILAAQTPVLPVPDCSMPGDCRCRYRKFSDRREDEEGRRFRYGAAVGIWYSGSQRRFSRGRRDRD